jgi:hypothetical protein
MKCAASNRQLKKKRVFETGSAEALKKMSLFLDYVLSDKLRYTNTRIKQIHTSFNKVALDVTEGRRSIGEIIRFLQDEYHADFVGLDNSNRIRPEWLKSDFVGGVNVTTQSLSIVLIYVLLHQYKFSAEKCNRVIQGINDIASGVNQGYIKEDEIREILFDEEGLVVEKLGGVRK